jgi:hypothetical protein
MNGNLRGADERPSRTHVTTSVNPRAVSANGQPPERPAVLPEAGFVRIRQILAVYKTRPSEPRG